MAGADDAIATSPGLGNANTTLLSGEDLSAAVKRRKSLQSLQTLQSVQNMLSGALAPRKKRHKVIEDLPSIEPYEGLGVVFDKDPLHDGNEPVPYTDRDAPPTFTNPFARNEQEPGVDSLSCMKTSSSMVEQPMAVRSHQTAPLLTVEHYPTVRTPSDRLKDNYSGSSGYSTINAAADACYETTRSNYAIPGRWSSVEEVTQRVREISSNRPIDTYSDAEIKDMKLAADYLKVLTLEADAFGLYVLILKHYQSISKQLHHVVSAAALNCADSAGTAAHREIAKSLLSPKLDEDEEGTTNVERFLFRMLFAQIYSRECHFIAAADQMNYARRYGSSAHLISQLPAESRGLDLITYHNLMRCFSFDCDLTSIHLSGFHPDKVLSTEKSKLVELMLDRTPGPFEIQFGFMKNPCIRSCVEWCNRETLRMTLIPGVWKTLGSKSKCVLWSETIAHFSCLWER